MALRTAGGEATEQEVLAQAAFTFALALRSAEERTLAAACSVGPGSLEQRGGEGPALSGMRS